MAGFNFKVEKAERKKIYPKIAIFAASGGGKTYSSLRLATGMCAEIERQTGKKAKILFANTEGDRGLYYADEFDYDIVDLEAPHEPEMYVKLIEYAEEEGYGVLIIDSSSKEWDGKGGMLDIHAKAGGEFKDWKKVNPRHEKFMEKINKGKLAIICTMRGKDQYEVSKNENGKTSIQKLGVGSKQRDGFEYEFTCTFSIDVKSNVADCQKDNTHIFDSDTSHKLTEEDGANIIKWANSAELKKGKEESNIEIKKLENEIQEMSDSLPEEFEEEVIEDDGIDYEKEVATLFKALPKGSELKKEVAKIIKQYGKLTDCPKSVQKELYEKLK